LFSVIQLIDVLYFVAILRQWWSLQQDCWSDKTWLRNSCNTWRSLGPRCVYTR